MLHHRRQAVRHLGRTLPREIATGPVDTLPRRIAALDRWIARELDLAGGRQLPPWEEPDDDGGDDDPGPSFRSR